MAEPASGDGPGHGIRGVPLVGAVLMGGRSSRFGSDKALADAGGRPLGLRVADALRQGGADPVVAVGGRAGARLGLATVADRAADQGPLAGLASILLWARTGLVVVAPCDLPLLTGGHVAALVAAAGTDPGLAGVAATGPDQRPQPSLACWPAAAGPRIQQLVDAGHRAWRDALSVVAWAPVPLPAEALTDADTPVSLQAILHNDGRSNASPPASGEIGRSEASGGAAPE